MPKMGWWLVAASALAMPAWAWDVYRSYPGTPSALQLRNDIGALERQVRDLQRQVDQLQARGSGARPAQRYPLPGQSIQGFRPSGQGNYELALNGALLQIAANGDIRIRAGGVLRLEGESVATRSREATAAE